MTATQINQIITSLKPNDSIRVVEILNNNINVFEGKFQLFSAGLLNMYHHKGSCTFDLIAIEINKIDSIIRIDDVCPTFEVRP